MDSDKNIYSWIIVILIIALFVVYHFSYKEGYKRGQDDQVASTTENAGNFCKDTLQDEMYEFCAGATENYIADNSKKICNGLDYISTEVCYERIHEATSEVKNQESTSKSINPYIDFFGDDQAEKFKEEKEGLEDQLKEQQKYIDVQQDYQDCIRRWSDRLGFIDPDDADSCRLLYSN